MRFWGIAVALVLTLAVSAGAEDSSRRLDNLAWMKIGAGARAQALGGAFTARADDGTAAYWNPAFLSSFGAYDTEICLMALPLDFSRRAGFLSYGQTISPNWGGVAASWNYYRAGDIEERDDAGLPTGSLEDLANGFSLSYGLGVGPDWKVGTSLHYYWHSLADTEGRGVGLDLAAAYKPKGPWVRWELGAALKDLSPGMFWGTGRHESVNPTLRLGVAYHILYDQLIAAVDFEMPWQQKIVPHAGMEWWAWEFLAVRAGLDPNGVYLGAGYRAGQYQFDYAYSALLDGLSHEHRLTLMLKL
ncbi:MAG: PorV/PorQ family protein [Candidatus Firestonebacteria bacterium]|nr:PorV/PorQ family protein [Candidatus Firestonebacteria bacterium]